MEVRYSVSSNREITSNLSVFTMATTVLKFSQHTIGLYLTSAALSLQRGLPRFLRQFSLVAFQADIRC